MAPQPQPTKAASGQPPLFKGISYYIAPCIPFENHDGIRIMLNANGANEAESIREAEYIFTDSEGFEGASEVSVDAALVRPQWVERSLANKTKQDPKYFSPSPRAIFSTLVIATDQLPPGDVEAVVAGVHAKGGMYREGLTRDVTHLLVLGPTGDKYATARKYADQTGIKIVMVHWFDDCCHLGQRLPEAPYEQLLLQAEEEMNQSKGGPTDVRFQKKIKPKLSSKARLIYGSIIRAQTPPRFENHAQLPSSSAPDALPTSSSPSKFGSSSPVKSNKVRDYLNNPPVPQNVWNGRRILFSRSLLLSNDRRNMLEAEIQRFGGDVVRLASASSKGLVGTSVAGEGDEDEEDELDSDSDAEEGMQFEIDLAEKRVKGDTPQIGAKYKEKDTQEALLIMEGKVDVFVTKYRSGLGYIAALTGARGRRDISIGTIPWLFFCHDSGSISPPTSQLLHYPVRRGFVEGIRGKQITISNYSGQARDYLKKLITIMAGPLPPKGSEVFTATLCRNTDYVIAGKLEGQKVEKASSWHLPIVNHLWLEDSFKDWKLVSLTVPKYTHWSPNISYTELLPNCSIYQSNRGKDIVAYLKEELDIIESEMADIGYNEAYIHYVHANNLESLRHLLDTSASFLQEDEPTASNALIERDLMGDEDTVMANIEDSASPGKATRARKTLSGTKTNSSRNVSPSKKSPVKSKMEITPERNPSDVADELRREVMEGFSRHLSQSAMDLTPSKRGSALRSPWDPVSKRKAAAVVTNDTPQKKTAGKETRTRKASEGEEKRSKGKKKEKAVAEERIGNGRHSIDLETKEEAVARYRRNKGKVIEREVESSPSPVKKKLRSEPPSLSPSSDGMNMGGPPTASLSRHSSTNEDDITAEKLVGKRAKRDIRTQDSDEEFQVESIGNLMTRREKVAGVRPDTKGRLSMDKDKKQKDQRHRSSTSHQQQDESDGDDWSDSGKPVSAKTSKVMKKLRDSISGKEDNRTTPKKKGRESTGMEDEGSPPPKTRTQGKKSTPRKPTKSQSDDSEDDEDQPKDHPTRTKATAKSTQRTKQSVHPAEDPMDSSESDQSDRHSDTRHSPRRKSTSVSNADDQDEEAGSRVRRGAATKATQLLRDKIMPDANRFANEVRRGSIRGDWEDKKRKRDEIEEEDRKKRRKSTADSDTNKATSSKRAETVPKTGIRMATTKVPLTDDELNKLRRLGIQLVEDPKTCTHLVTNSILRTEKFLCAISVAPVIVKENWIRECLKNGRVMDDSKYHLWDPEGEKRFGIVLQETLERARENGTRLFDGHTFYLSPSLAPVVYDTLKNAIDSAGGKSIKQYPNPRTLEGHLEDKHFIGATGDKSKSKQLTERSIPVYSQELVLNAILRQELPEWDESDVLLDN